MTTPGRTRAVAVIDTSARHRLLGAAVPGHGTATWCEVGGGADAAVTTLLQLTGALSADALVVVTAPGSLTGIRAGVAAALGVAAVRGLAVHGVGSLELVALAALATAGPPGLADGAAVTAVRPAGRGGLWVGRFASDGGGLRTLARPARVLAAGWVPPPDEPAAALDEGVPGIAPIGREGHLGALVAGARLALTRPPVDVLRVDPATGRGPGAGV